MRRSKRSRAVAALCCAVVVALMSTTARATDYTFIVPSGTFSTAGNWTPIGGPPNLATDRALFVASPLLPGGTTQVYWSQNSLAQEIDISGVGRIWATSIGGAYTHTSTAGVNIVSATFEIGDDQPLEALNLSLGGALSIGGGAFIANDYSTVTAGNLILGTAVPGSAAVTIDGSGSMLTVTGTGAVTVGSVDNNATLNIINGGALVSGTGQITINDTGAVTVDGGSLLANGDIDLAGGTFDVLSGDFILASGKGMFATSSAQANFAAGYEIENDTRIEVRGGSNFTFASSLGVGNGSVGTLLVYNTDSTLTTGTSDTQAVDWGSDGGIGRITVSVDAIATILADAIHLGRADSVGRLTVRTGSDFTANTMYVGVESTGTGRIDVYSEGSTLTLAGASQLFVGGDGASNAVVTVYEGGTFTTGTGVTTIASTGRVTIGTAVAGEEGVFNAKGDVHVVGGRLEKLGGVFNLAAGKDLFAYAGGQVDFNGSYTIGGGSTFEITDGADMTVGSYLDVGYLDNGSLLVSGVGSTLTTNTTSTGFAAWGSNGHVATVHFTDLAQVDIDASLLFMAISGTTGTAANVIIDGGADLQLNTLRMATGTLGNASLAVTGIGSTVTQNGTSTLNVGGASSTAIATLDIHSGGVFTTGTGLTTIGAGGVVNVGNGSGGQVGTLNVNGNLAVNGGELYHKTGGVLNLPFNITLTATDNALVDFIGSYSLGNGRTFAFESGADFHVAGNFEIGNATTGTLILGGAGSTITANSISAYWGQFGGHANVTLRSQADFAFNLDTIYLASLGNNSGGTISVESGAELTINNLLVGGDTFGATNTSAIVTVAGAGSRLTQLGASTLVVGGSAVGNTAVVNLFAGGTLTTGAGVTTLNPNGVINIAGGALHTSTINHTLGGALSFTGGTLSVDTFLGNLDQHGGTLAPGRPTAGEAAISHIIGDFTMTGGAVAIEIGGTGIPGVDFDLITVDGTATLAGAINVSLLPGFTLQLTDTFTVLVADSIIGTFDTIVSGHQGGLYFDVTYIDGVTDSVQVTVLQAILYGDANNDGVVDAADFTAVEANLGATGVTDGLMLGDANDDGRVDGADWLTVELHFGNVFDFPGQSVPEPTTATLCFAGVLTLLSRRRAA